MSRAVETLRAIAAEDVPASAQLRMLICALAAANWVAIMMLLLVVGDMTPAEPAIELAAAMSGVCFGLYFVFSKAPEITRALLAVFAPTDERAQLDGGLPIRYRLAPTAALVVVVIGGELLPRVPPTMRQYASTAALELLVVAALVGLASVVISTYSRVEPPGEERDE